MDTTALDFEIPEDRIATRPATPRDSARLMVVRRHDASAPPEHRVVADLPDILDENDLLVFNSSKVLPARFEGTNIDTGGSVEGLWLGDAQRGVDGGLRWRVMLKARRFRAGRRVELAAPDGSPGGVQLTLIERLPVPEYESGSWLVEVRAGFAATTPMVLERVGRAPLPPYIRKARRSEGSEVADAEDRDAYRCLYASDEPDTDAVGHRASVAAPTAGLHFTEALLANLSRAGVSRSEVKLHVGAGTFRTIDSDRVEDHVMHSEWCSMDPRTIGDVFADPSRRVIAVGSTSTRTIEAYAEAMASGAEAPGSLETDLMIAPGYRWRRIDGLMTNFHLPRSTLLLMVAAAMEGGIERLRDLYDLAVRERYRFFSYGDAMLLL